MLASMDAFAMVPGSPAAKQSIARDVMAPRPINIVDEFWEIHSAADAIYQMFKSPGDVSDD